MVGGKKNPFPAPPGLEKKCSSLFFGKKNNLLKKKKKKNKQKKFCVGGKKAGVGGGFFYIVEFWAPPFLSTTRALHIKSNLSQNPSKHLTSGISTLTGGVLAVIFFGNFGKVKASGQPKEKTGKK